MKAPAFDYARAASVDEVLALLESHGDDAMILAGGQSLMPMLNMRLARPGLLIDVNGLDELRGIRREDGVVRIGAATRYFELMDSPVIRDDLPLLAEALPHVAHVAIRNRGTIGGSIALADPAAELPACALALGAEFILVSREGSRTVAANGFFRGLYETERREDEILTEIRFPIPSTDCVSSFYELSRRHGDFALAGIACHGHATDGRFADLRLVYFGTSDRPVLATTTAQVACEAPFSEAALPGIGAALEDELDPLESLHGSRAFKLHLAKVITGRALDLLAERAGG